MPKSIVHALIILSALLFAPGALTGCGSSVSVRYDVPCAATCVAAAATDLDTSVVGVTELGVCLITCVRVENDPEPDSSAPDSLVWTPSGWVAPTSSVTDVIRNALSSPISDE